MKKELSCINLREDYAFKYVFSKDAKENRGALKCLVQNFTDCYLEEFIVENSDEKYSEDECFITLNGKTDAGVWEKFTVCMIEKKGTFYKKFINPSNIRTKSSHFIECFFLKNYIPSLYGHFKAILGGSFLNNLQIFYNYVPLFISHSNNPVLSFILQAQFELKHRLKS